VPIDAWPRGRLALTSMIVFESEDAARQAADRIPEGMPEHVRLENVEVREVIANA
jgi:hypothetical protein